MISCFWRHIWLRQTKCKRYDNDVQYLPREALDRQNQFPSNQNNFGTKLFLNT